MGRVQGKVALISGGASGIGEACALALSREGATVFIADLDAGRGEALAAGDPNLRYRRLDVTRPEDWSAAVAEILAEQGHLDVLINSAGIVVQSAIAEVSIEQFRNVVRVNLEGTFLGCQAALKAMEAGRGGSIVNLGSVAGLIGDPPEIPSYTASKGAVIALTRSIAVHCLRNAQQIRCNAICPGNIRTPMLEQAVIAAVGAERLDETLAAMAEHEPMGRPEDVAALALYLASDESRMMNGAIIPLDGGYSVS